MISDDTRLKIASDATHQSLGEREETVILSLKTGHLYTCNDTTAAMLKVLQDKPTFGTVVDRLLEQFEVPRETLRRDLAAMADRLIAEGIVETA
jgi:hypothetical protein